MHRCHASPRRRRWDERAPPVGGSLPHDTDMFEPLARVLRLALHRPRADVVAHGHAAGGTARRGPTVEFVAYAEDCILSGRVRLDAERLTDMLNEREEILLSEVMVERHDAGGTVELNEILIARDEILLAQATGPRGSQARRRRTRQHALALRVGPYEVHGYFHERPGLEPLAAILRRQVMVPLTDSWIEYPTDVGPNRVRVGAILVNRDHIAAVALGDEPEVLMVDLPVPTEQGPLLKDFTGVIVGDGSTR